MVNIPRPRIFISVLVWVVSCCGILMIWQVPPQLSSSSLHSSPSSSSSSSSSSSASGGAGDFVPRFYNKPARRTHVSNLLYLQRKERERTDSPLVKSKPSDTISSKSHLTPRAKPYPKISFRKKVPKTVPERSSLGSGRDKNPDTPMHDPITYHRSRVKDATPKDAHPDSLREEKRRLVQRHRNEMNAYKTQRNRDKRKENSAKRNLTSRHLNNNNNNNKNNNNNNNQKKNDESDTLESGEKPTKNNFQDDYYSSYDETEEDDEYYEDEDEYQNDEYYDDDEEEGKAADVGGKFNVTPTDASLLMYNRVPKCASSTMQTILRRLSRHLNYEHVSSLIYDQHKLSPDDQEKLVENLTSSVSAAPSHALSYDRHLYYTNFTGLGMNPPVYINIVRDPVERFISSFYYRRSEERINRIQMHGKTITPSLSWANRTVEQCVLNNDTECVFLPGEEKELMLSYFCGHHEFCRIVGNRDALQSAKQIVSKEYSVVGLVEHMDLSLLLLETLVPRFMDGASQIYENIRQREHMAVNVNQQKPKVPLAVREELLRRMTDDLDFYYFLEQRLFQQKKNFLFKR